MSDFPNRLVDYSPQTEATDLYSGIEFVSRSPSDVFSEDEELELASELLEVATEQELEEFVDGVIRNAERALNQAAEPSVEQDIGDILKGIAKVALPIAGGVLGGFVGGPAGAALGSNLAATAGHAFGLELEGLSPEDSEFEISKQFIKFAGATVKIALKADPSVDPANIAHEAAVEAARLHAPGLMNISEASNPNHPNCCCNGRSLSNTDKGDITMPNLGRTQLGSSAPSFGGASPQTRSGWSEDDEMNLAANLMELETEEEFEGFLDSLISQGKQLINSPVGQAVGATLKDAAKQLLPVAGQAVGSRFGGPIGGQIGGALGTAVADQFEAEAEEREWEAANVFVRVALDAVNNAANAPTGSDPQAVAENAVAEAVRRHAPHVAHAFSHHGRDWATAPHRRHSGRWARRGREIILFGV
jgi:uncharacterized protein (DUF697 family)